MKKMKKMKKITGLFLTSAVVMAFAACNPVENRQEMKGATTKDKIDQLVSVTQLQVADPKTGEMKPSNLFNFNSDGLDALSSFEYDLGEYRGTQEDSVVCVYVPGQTSIIFTAHNGDGSTLTKTFGPFTVDSCLKVPIELSYLCGEDSKSWTWDMDTDDPDDGPYGQGDAYDFAPDWWSTWNDEGIAKTPEGIGAYMTFAKTGILTKTTNKGQTTQGKFGFVLGKNANDDRWTAPIGKITTSGITLLYGVDTDSGDDVYAYDVSSLDPDHLVLGKLMDSTSGDDGGQPDQEGWGQVTWWFFAPYE